jgi:hypothetical protein
MNLHSKGLERNIRDTMMGEKNKTLFDFLIGFWHSK